MLDFIIFLLSTIGATLIITQSYLFKDFREKIKNKYFSKMIKCTQCMGFHIGFLFKIIMVLYYRENYILYFSDFYYILYGFIGSFISYLTYLLIKPLINKYD